MHTIHAVRNVEDDAVSQRAVSSLRLTRRGRAVITALIALPLVTGVAIGSVNGGGAVASRTAAAASFDTVTVQPGESLWEIAERTAPQVDPRDAVRDILDLNQLSSAVVQPGQSLALPNY